MAGGAMHLNGGVSQIEMLAVIEEESPVFANFITNGLNVMAASARAGSIGDVGGGFS